MPGFSGNKNVGPLTKGPVSSRISDKIKDLSRMGMRYDDLVIRNSRAIGIAENEYGYRMNPVGSDSDDMWYTFAALSLTDTSMKKNVCFFDKAYKKKREDLRVFAVQDEIEDILDIICDETIVYNDKNFFCQPVFLSGDVDDKIKKNLEINFRKIYTMFNFMDGQSAWNYFRKWMVDGYLAFEIIYDNYEKPKNVIGFKEIDPVSLVPGIDKETNKKIYIQYKGEGAKERKLYDSQVIYISWSSINSPSRISYVERLLRAFNLLRIMEHTRIIWAVMNASFKMKFIIPVGGKSKTRAKQSLATLMHNYREMVEFDYQSGELKTNGRPFMAFNKEYWLPSKDGEAPEIEVVGGEGPELSDTETLKYFSDKLKMVSKIPFSRFDKDSPAGYEIAAEGMQREEIRFSKFINRIRSIFQEIMVKPLYIQMILNHPELKDDESFKSSISIRFYKENVFDEMKTMELTGKRVEFIQNLRDSLTDMKPDMSEEKYFDLDFLIERFGNFDAEDLEANRIYKLAKKIESEGYSKVDSIKIARGESKDKFIKENPPEASGMAAPPMGGGF